MAITLQTSFLYLIICYEFARKSLYSKTSLFTLYWIFTASLSSFNHLLSCRAYIFDLSVMLFTVDTNHRHNHQKLPAISLVTGWPLHRLLTTLLLSNKSKLLPTRGRTAARQRQMEAPGVSPKRPYHHDVIKWKYFPRYWPFMRGMHRSPVNSPHKGQWRGASMFSLICVWINDWVNNHEAGDFIRYRAHYDVSVMWSGISLHKVHSS